MVIVKQIFANANFRLHHRLAKGYPLQPPKYQSNKLLNVCMKKSRIAIRLTEQEKADLVDKAEEYKITLSQFIRLKLMSKTDIPIIRVDFDGYKLLGETNVSLVKIGTNINQLAHNANLSIQMGSQIDLEVKYLTEIKEIVDQAKKNIKNIKLKLEELRYTNDVQ